MPSLLLTAGGRITCVRCTAKSTRTKQQCGRPALKSSKSNKCQFHGGRSTGPQSAAARQKISNMMTVHGRETQQARRLRSEKLALLRALEDVLHFLAGRQPPKRRGRRPTGYKVL